jgi:radical SAM superfamily enzyme YgiQ (UPF0313 family)
MDSMINRYTADRKIRSDDAYTPGGAGGKRPDRASLVYTQRCKEAFKDVPVVIGGIEASLRRIAHYDYWQDKVRRSMLVDAKADLLLYGNAERAIVEIAHRLAAREPIERSPTCAAPPSCAAPTTPRLPAGSRSIPPRWTSPAASTSTSTPTRHQRARRRPAGQQLREGRCRRRQAGAAIVQPIRRCAPQRWPPSITPPRERTVIRLPSLRAGEERPGALRPRQPRAAPGDQPRQRPRAGAAPRRPPRDVWINPPPIPLTTAEMDHVFDLPYARSPHPATPTSRAATTAPTKIPAWEMIRFSVNIMRGCFGGCTFCSITEHEGRIIQSRSEDSVIREIEDIRDKVKGFTGVISDLGGPTANMYRMAARARRSRPPAASPAASTRASART